MDTNLNETDIETLINQAKNGDSQSFADLYQHFYTPLFRFVKYRTGNHDMSLDICQEVFLNWYKSLNTYEIKIKPISYLMMIAMRLIINDSKKEKSLHLPEDVEEFLADESIIDQNIKFDFDLEINQIKKMFTELSEREQNLLALRYVSDADTSTIAESINISIENVRQIESRALKKLKLIIKNKDTVNKESHKNL
jgi:RNA polymerase sigma factor (sigma-70 family)